MSNFSGICSKTSINPFPIYPFPILVSAIYETANPPNIKRTTWTMSVIATAFKPPDKEYASDKIASRIIPFISDNPVSVLIAIDPSHKTAVKFTKI